MYVYIILLSYCQIHANTKRASKALILTTTTPNFIQICWTRNRSKHFAHTNVHVCVMTFTIVYILNGATH